MKKLAGFLIVLSFLFSFQSFSQILTTTYCGYWKVVQGEYSDLITEEDLNDLKITILARNNTFYLNKDFYGYKKDEKYCWELPKEFRECPLRIVFCDGYNIIVDLSYEGFRPVSYIEPINGPYMPRCGTVIWPPHPSSILLKLERDHD